MQGQRWMRNAKVKAGALVAALVATAGFYTLVTGNPPTHATAPDGTTPATASPTAAPATTPPPFQPGGSSLLPGGQGRLPRIATQPPPNTQPVDPAARSRPTRVAARTRAS